MLKIIQTDKDIGSKPRNTMKYGPARYRYPSGTVMNKIMINIFATNHIKYFGNFLVFANFVITKKEAAELNVNCETIYNDELKIGIRLLLKINSSKKTWM